MPDFPRIVRPRASVPWVRELGSALLLAAAGVLLAVYVLYYQFLLRRMFDAQAMNDFGRFYYSAVAFLNGESMYGPTPATPMVVGDRTFQLWNMNPPHFHVLILPLALLTPLHALFAWWTVNVAALIFSLRLIAQQTGLRWTVRRVLLTIFGVVLSSATGAVVVTGQVSFLLMLPTTMAWTDARRGRWNRAALLLGLIASIKPFLGLFLLYLLLTRRWRPMGRFLMSAAASIIVGLAVFGWDAYGEWLRVLSGVDWAVLPMNASLTGMIQRSFTNNPVFLPLVRLPLAVAPITAMLAAVVGGVTIATLIRDRSPEAADRAFAILLLAALLISPLGWMYYLWLAAGPIAALVMSLRSRSWSRDIAIVLTLPGLFLPLFVTTLWSGNPWNSFTLGSLYGWTALWMWAAVCLDANPGCMAAVTVA
jgi:alpha-1,2-mannosyltransferase